MLRVEGGIHAYPDEVEYPNRRYPIACILKKGHDRYDQNALFEYDGRKLERFRAKRAAALRSVEIAAVLLAMTQEKANCLDRKCFDEKRLIRSSSFLVQGRSDRFVCKPGKKLTSSLPKPFVVFIDSHHAQVVRGRASLEYMQALDQIIKIEGIPNGLEITISKSDKIDCLVQEDLVQLFSALDAIIRNCENVEPLFLSRTPLPQEANDFG